MDFDIFNYYKEELDTISHPLVRRGVEYLLSKAPSYYMSVDAASNPNYCKDRDGNIIKLREHTKQATRYMILFLSHPIIKSQFDSVTQDLMKGAMLIHDLAKYGTNDEPTNHILFEHPILVAKLVDNSLQYQDLDLYNAIMSILELSVTHSGPWTTNNYSNVILPSISNNAQYYVHLCDWMASRSMTWIDNSFDLTRL